MDHLLRRCTDVPIRTPMSAYSSHKFATASMSVAIVQTSILVMEWSDLARRLLVATLGRSAHFHSHTMDFSTTHALLWTRLSNGLKSVLDAANVATSHR